eukprot:403344469
MIINRYNDETLTQDPNKRLQVPPQVKEVQVFTQTLHRLSKVNIPKLAVEKMENYEIEQKDKEYTKLINDNKFIKIKIPGRRIHGDNTAKSIQTQRGEFQTRNNQKVIQQIPQQNSQTSRQNQNLQNNINSQTFKLEEIKTPMSQEEAYMQGTIMEEKEERSKIIREMEERFNRRNNKSQRELIVKIHWGLQRVTMTRTFYRILSPSKTGRNNVFRIFNSDCSDYANKSPDEILRLQINSQFNHNQFYIRKMKIYFTPREMIINRYNDETLTQDPNKRLQVPPQVKEVQVFTQTLHRLSKVNIPKLAIEKMENYEIEQKDKEYTKLINDNKFIKIKIPGRRIHGDNTAKSIQTQRGEFQTRNNQKVIQQIPQQNSQTSRQNQNLQNNINSQTFKLEEIKTPMSQEEAYMQGTIMEEKEERSKIIREMEERFNRRNNKSQRELIVKNPLGIVESDYDTKVYKNTITKQDRADNVSEIDEGKQMVFALPSISTKKAKILHSLVNQNVIKEDRCYRNQCSRVEREQYSNSKNKNLTLTRCAFYPANEFSFIKDSFMKRLNVKDDKNDKDKKGLNPSRTMELLNQTASSFNLSPDKSDKNSVKSRRIQPSQSQGLGNKLRRRGTILGSPMHNQISMMHQTIQHFHNPDDDKIFTNDIEKDLSFTKSVLQQQMYQTDFSFQTQSKPQNNIQNSQNKKDSQQLNNSKYESQLPKTKFNKKLSSIAEFDVDSSKPNKSKINDKNDKNQKASSISPFKKHKSSPSFNFQDAIYGLELSKKQGSAMISNFSQYTPMSPSKQQMSPTQQKKYLIQRQLEKQFELELRKFENKFQKNKFDKAIEYFSQTSDPTQTSQYDLPFKKKVTSKILQYISQGEQNDKLRLLQGGSKSGRQRLIQQDILVKQMSDNVVGEIKKAKVHASLKLREIQKGRYKQGIYQLSKKI